MPKKYLQEGEHTHRWIEGKNQNVWYCDQDDCHKVRITADEYERRIKEWENYYELVKTTSSYQYFKGMQKAFWEKNKPEMVRLRDQITARLKADDYMPKPNFDDPQNRKYEVVE